MQARRLRYFLGLRAGLLRYLLRSQARRLRYFLRRRAGRRYNLIEGFDGRGGHGLDGEGAADSGLLLVHEGLVVEGLLRRMGRENGVLRFLTPEEFREPGPVPPQVERATFNRDLALDNPAVQLPGIGSPLVDAMLQKRGSYGFGGNAARRFGVTR